jgi:hypothetical protein
VLTITNLLPIVEEDTGQVGLSGATATGPQLGASDATNPNYDPNFSFYEPGTIVFSTVQSGVIATAGETIHNTGGSDFYRLIPANTANIEYGNNSFIYTDGASWQMKFLNNAYLNERIFVSYVYGASADYKPMYVAFFHNVLVMANTYEDGKYNPWRLRWGGPGDLYKTQASSYIDVAVGDITPILDLKVVETSASSTIKSFLYIYKQNAIVRGTYNRAWYADPNLPAPFLELDEAYSEGLETVRTVQLINGTQVYLGRNDVYAFNGYERVSLTYTPGTGASRVREYIFDNLDLDNLNLCFSVYDEVNKQYILFVKLLTDTTDYPTTAFALDMERGTWTRHVFPQCSAALAADFTPNASIDSLKGNIEDLEGTIEDLAGNSTKLVILAMTKKTYVQGDGDTDRTEKDVYRFYENPLSEDYIACYPDGTYNGKGLWRGFQLTPGLDDVVISWTGTNWRISINIVYESTHPTGTGLLPPETGWGPASPGSGTPVIRAVWEGETFDSFFLTRDFVGGTIENQDRTQMVYVEGSRGSIELGYNTDYSTELSDFTSIAEKPFGLKYTRNTFSPDITANNIRFLVRLKDGAIFRWMQVFSIKQDLTNL